MSNAELREPFGGRFFGIFDVEGEGDPVALFRSKEEAGRELARRKSLPHDDDDWLSEYHHMLLCDVAGTVWNSFDPDPRADNPLSPDEILAVHGDG